jgi:hypothetical protein
MNKTLYSVLAIVLVLAIAGASFYGGMLFGKSQAQSSAAAQGAVFVEGTALRGQAPDTRFPSANGTPGVLGRRNGQGGNFTLGTIKQIGDGSLVLTDNNGKDTEVKVTDTTLIEKNQSVKLSDLSEGETVMVSGPAAADGTITARSVQVAPQGRFGFGGPGDGQPPAQGVNAQATPSR